jgi:hypothetical protein
MAWFAPGSSVEIQSDYPAFRLNNFIFRIFPISNLQIRYGVLHNIFILPMSMTARHCPSAGKAIRDKTIARDWQINHGLALDGGCTIQQRTGSAAL